MSEDQPTGSDAAANTPPSGRLDVADRPDVIDLRDAPQLLDEQPTPPTANPFVAVLALLLVIGVIVGSGNYRMVLIVLAFAAMIMLHEFGHFITARLTGMKATEFFIGFGPRLWSFRRGETEYGIKALPLGGYVKILGMHNLDRVEDPADEPRTYRQATFPRRVLVASAGTLTHLLIAFVLFAVLFSGTGRIIDTDAVRIRSVEPTLNGTVAPAVAAGLRVGDVIYAINGKRVKDQTDVVAAVRPHPGVALDFTIYRSQQFLHVKVTPVRTDDPQLGVVGRIGVESDSQQIVKEPWSKGIPSAANQVVTLVPETFRALGGFFAPHHLKTYSKSIMSADRPAVAGQPQDTNRFLSPVGAVQLLEGASQNDIRWAIFLFASINVFVGIFNMLPVLPLDGGHVLLAVYERIRSRKGRRYRVDVTKMLPLTYAVVAIMLAIGISSLYLDIRNPIKLF